MSLTRRSLLATGAASSAALFAPALVRRARAARRLTVASLLAADKPETKIWLRIGEIVEVTGAKVCARGRSLRSPGSLKTSPSGAEFIDIDFSPDIVMGDGDAVSGPDWRLEALVTPGHAPDHLCFAEASSNVLFCGDHVMSWNTTVVAPPEGNMTDYMRSLEKLLERKEPVFMPGHGGRIEQPNRMVKAYIVHRRWREQAILDAVRQGHVTIDRIVAAVYQGLDPKLVRAASLSVLAHIESLIDRGLVSCDGPPGLDRPVSAA